MFSSTDIEESGEVSGRNTNNNKIQRQTSFIHCKNLWGHVQGEVHSLEGGCLEILLSISKSEKGYQAKNKSVEKNTANQLALSLESPLISHQWMKWDFMSEL